MIIYESGVQKVFQLSGSVFPQALRIALPTGVLSSLLTLAVYDAEAFGRGFDPEATLMKNNAIWGGFTFLVGFLVVFRTSVAYSRFWEGCTHVHDMGATWYDACSGLVAFCRHCPADKRGDMCRFQHILVRLFSMMHAAALGDITDSSDLGDVLEAYSLELIDAGAIDQQSLVTVMESSAKVELMFQWLQGLLVEYINVGVLTIPPPILTRSFQSLSKGKQSFEDALKISIVPFPFPYAQTCDCMLLMHWVAVPFIVTQWMVTWWLAFIFAFVQVFTLWTLNLIAEELENPFGLDPNDIDSVQLQTAMNRHLRLLISSSVQRLPTLQPDLDLDELATNMTYREGQASFFDMWAELSSKQGVRVQRRCASVPRSTARLGASTSSRSWAPRGSRQRPSDARSSPFWSDPGHAGAAQHSASDLPSRQHKADDHDADDDQPNGRRRRTANADQPTTTGDLCREPSLQSWPSSSGTPQESAVLASPGPPDKPWPVARMISVPRLPLDMLR